MRIDYGFDMPDARQTWILNDGSMLTLWIVRDWYTPEDPEEDEEGLNFDVSYKLVHYPDAESSVGEVVMQFPQGKGQGLCEAAVELLYADQIDSEASRIERREIKEREYAERMGL